MGQLHLGRVLVAQPRLAGGQQACLDQPVQQPFAGGWQPVQQLVLRHHPAGALGGDQPQQDVPGHGDVLGGQGVQHPVGVACQRPGHPAQLRVRLAGELSRLAIPPLPQHARGELQQGQRGLLLAGCLDHLGHQLGILVGVAHGLHWTGEDLAQLVRLGGADQGHPAQGRAHRGPARGLAQEVFPQGEDHPVRPQRVIGRRAHGLQEGPALARVRPQGVELLQLVNEKEHPAAQLDGHALQDQGEVGRVGPEQFVHRGRPLGVRAHTGQGRAPLAGLLWRGDGLLGGEQGVTMLAREADHLLHRGAQCAQRIRAGAQVQHPPRALLPQAGDHAGVHEGALARARGPHHGEHRLTAQALQEGVQLLVAAVEQGRVLLVEGEQPGEGVQVRGLGGLLPGEDPAQGRRQVAGRWAGRRVLVHALGHQAAQISRNLIPLLKARGRVAGDHLGGQVEHGVAVVGAPAAQQLKEHHPGGPDVGGRGALAAPPLLRGHVRGRALGAARILLELDSILLRSLAQGVAQIRHAGHVIPARGHLGQAEVHHAQAPVSGDDHVLRLQVPVQDIMQVGLLQGLGHGQDNAKGGLHPKAAGDHAVAQVLPVQILQGQVRVPLVQAHGVDSHDVRVGEAGRGAGLEQEPLHVLVRASARGPLPHHLEGHLAPQARVPGQVHVPHAAPAHKAHHPEVVHHVLGAEERSALFLSRRHHPLSDALSVALARNIILSL